MQKVLVIAGAGGGLGSLVAQSEAGNFRDIVLLGDRKEPLEKTAALVREAGTATPKVEVADVTDEKRLEEVLSGYGSLDGLVNAAGVLGPVAKFGQEDWSAWKRALEVNLIGTASSCRLALPALLASRRGKIVNFSGGGAAGVREYHTAYASSKAAVVRFTEIFAREYPQLDANAIAPGAHNTDIWKRETHDKPPAKWADKNRFCGLVSYLLSEKSDGVSGKFIHINDNWEKFRPEISKSDMYSLRRMEPSR